MLQIDVLPPHPAGTAVPRGTALVTTATTVQLLSDFGCEEAEEESVDEALARVTNALGGGGGGGGGKSVHIIIVFIAEAN